MGVENHFSNLTKIAEVDDILESRKWVKEIPYIKFLPEWEVRVMPNFGGSVARFSVKEGVGVVSVYLDCHDNLGCYGSPYWEVYPLRGDTYRCDINETDKLLKTIKHSLEDQNFNNR